MLEDVCSILNTVILKSGKVSDTQWVGSSFHAVKAVCTGSTTLHAHFLMTTNNNNTIKQLLSL
jgi:hypothetical protein